MRTYERPSTQPDSEARSSGLDHVPTTELHTIVDWLAVHVGFRGIVQIAGVTASPARFDFKVKGSQFLVSFHGEIGPSLDGVAERYEEPQLRLQVVNAKAINPDTIMPAFYRTDGFHRVLKKFKDKTVLTAQQVEDIVAYLKTFK